MEEGIPRKPCEVSDQFDEHNAEVYQYTFNTFGFLNCQP